MTEQELIQENEKLNQRLTKAVEVFKEQKENITRLTQERDEAKNALDKKEATIVELRAKLDEKSNNDEKFFEQVNEIQVLERRVHKLESDYEDAMNTVIQKNHEIEELKSQSAGFQMQVDTANKLLADNETLMNNKLKALNDIIDETKASLEESQKQNGTLNERLNNAVAKFREQESIIESQNKDIDNLKNLLEEANDKNKKAEIDYNILVEAYEQSQNMLADTQAKMDTEISNLMSLIDEQNKTINTLNIENEKAKTQASQVKTKIQEMNRLGSDLINNFNMFE